MQQESIAATKHTDSIVGRCELDACARVRPGRSTLLRLCGGFLAGLGRVFALQEPIDLRGCQPELAPLNGAACHAVSRKKRVKPRGGSVLVRAGSERQHDTDSRCSSWRTRSTCASASLAASASARLRITADSPPAAPCFCAAERSRCRLKKNLTTALHGPVTPALQVRNCRGAMRQPCARHSFSGDAHLAQLFFAEQKLLGGVGCGEKIRC